MEVKDNGPINLSTEIALELFLRNNPSTSKLGHMMPHIETIYLYHTRGEDNAGWHFKSIIDGDWVGPYDDEDQAQYAGSQERKEARSSLGEAKSDPVLINPGVNSPERPWVLFTDSIPFGQKKNRTKIIANPAYGSPDLEDIHAIMFCFKDAILHQNEKAMEAMLSHLRDAHLWP